MSTFTKFKMQEFCLQTIEELGFQKPTSIQEQVIPLVYRKNSCLFVTGNGSHRS